MSVDPQLHQTQTDILHELLFRLAASFSELQKISGLTSDNFSFHVRQLVEQDLIKKTDNEYHLTAKGKEFANRFDTDERKVEGQPKVAVLLIVEKDDGKILGSTAAQATLLWLLGACQRQDLLG